MKKLYFAIVALLLCAISADAKTVYFKPNSNWKQANAEFCIYYWPNDGWIEMTPSSENGIWEAELPASYDGFKFVRMNPSRTSNGWESDKKWNEDKNIDLKAMGSNNLYTLNNGWNDMGGSWSVYTPAEPLPDPVYADVTFFVNNQKGWTKLNFYCWEDGASTVSAAWPGTAMSKLNDVTGVNDPDWATWYCVTIANTPINRPLMWIFNDGSNQTNDSDPMIVEEYDTTPEDGYQVYLTLSSNGGSMTSVEGIEIENAPVEYFNLQGVRVANPENGLYIRRQGNKVEKIFLRK